MSRQHPLKCAHGAIMDWAGFGCECGPHGACWVPEIHNAPEPCAQCDGPEQGYVEPVDANPERAGNGCMAYRTNGGTSAS